MFFPLYIGSYFNQAAYDVRDTSAFGRFRTLYQTSAADTLARSALYTGFTVRPMSMSPSDTFASIWQNTMQLLDMRYGGAYGFYSGTYNGCCPWLQTKPSKKDDDSKLTDEEKLAEQTAEKEFKKLAKLVNRYMNTHKIADADLETKLEAALKKSSKDKYVDAYEKLKEAYSELNKVDHEGLKETFTVMDEYKSAVEMSGYDYQSSKLKGVPKVTIISTLHTAVGEPSVEENKEKYNGDYYPELPLSTPGSDNNILKILGAWNNEYGKKDNGKEKSIIRVFTKKISESKKKYTGKACKSYIESNIKPFVDALRNKAEFAADNLENISDAESAHLKSLATALNTAYENIGKLEKDDKDNKDTVANLNSRLNALVTAFDNMYVALRIAEAKNIQATIKSDYKFIDDIEIGNTDDIATTNYIVEATVKDLQNEGFAGSIKTCGISTDVNVSEVKDGQQGGETVVTVEEAIDGYTAIKECRLEIDGKTGRTIYEENVATGKDGAKKLYYIDENGKLHEIDNLQYVNGSYTRPDPSKPITTKEVKADDVTKSQEEQEKINAMKEKGHTLAENAKKFGNDDSLIDGIDENNILYVLKGYKEKQGFFQSDFFKCAFKHSANRTNLMKMLNYAIKALENQNTDKSLDNDINELKHIQAFDFESAYKVNVPGAVTSYGYNMELTQWSKVDKILAKYVDKL